MKLTKILVVFIIITTVTSAIIYISNKRNNLVIEKRKPASKEDVGGTTVDPNSISLNKIHLTESKGGKLIWEMNAKVAVVDKEKGDTTMKVITLKFYGQDGNTFLLKGNICKINPQNKNISAEGKITITSQKGLRFFADNILWNSEKEILFIPDQATVKYKGIEIRGKQLTIDINTRNFRIKDVTTIIKSPT